MDRVVTVTEANQRFSELVRGVRKGDRVTITVRGEPVADLVPSKAKRRGEDIESILEFMRSQPIRFSGPWKREDLYD